MTNCPSHDHLTQFLAGGLAAAEEADLAAHLESCASCVRALEELTSPQPAVTPHAHHATTRILKTEQPSGLSGNELGRLRGMLPDRRHGWIAASSANETGLPEIPGYRIDGELGRGGMGVVYRAKQSQLNRPVALKVILNAQFATQEQVVRFLAEAQTCAAIRHPGIVQIFEVGQHAGVPFYSMELLEDGTLAEFIARHSVTARDAAALIEDIARAIHAAHLHGVVHRDLKPANILLQNVDQSKSRMPGRTSGNTSILRTQASPLAPKITDFGLARRFDLDAGLTQTGALLGTPDYMAPEQVEPGKHHIGPAADVYALGAMLYFLLTGRPPFAAATVMETLEAVKFRDAASPSRINQSIPHDLSIICLHCLEKLPNQRYATAEQMAEDLRRFLNGQPISARSISDIERLRKWASRNPGIAGLAGALLATVVIALTLVTWQWTRAVNARNRESKRADSETLARKNEAEARREAMLASASSTLDHGIQSCRDGQFKSGLLSMVRALELLPDGEPDLEFAIRANIDGWRRQVCSAEYNAGQGTALVSVAFSPDGQTAVTGNYGDAFQEGGPAYAMLWDVNNWSGPPLWKTAHPGAIWSVAFSPDGSRIALGGFDGTAAIIDAKTGAAASPHLPHSGRVYSVAFSPDGKTLAVGGHVNEELASRIGVAAFQDCDSGPDGPTQSMPVASATGNAPQETSRPGGPTQRSGKLELCRAFSPFLSPLNALRGLTATAEIVSAHPGLDHSHDRPIAGLRRNYELIVPVDDENKTLPSPGTSGELRLWDVATNTLIGEPHAFPFRIHSLAWHPNGKSIALGGLHLADVGNGAAGTAVMFDVATSTVTGNAMVHPDTVGAVAFVPHSETLATGCRDGLIRFWDLNSGKVDPAPLQQTRTINSLAFSRDGLRLAVASGHHEPGVHSGTGEVHIWNMATRQKLIAPPFERIQANSQKMHSVAFGNDDQKLVAVSEHGRAWLWDLPQGGQPIREWKFAQRSEIDHSPDGRKLLLNVLPPHERGFNEQPCEFHLIDTDDGHTIAVLPHPIVSRARFSPDSKLFATWGNHTPAVPASVTSAVHIWNADTGEEVALPQTFPPFVRTMHFTADSTTLLTVSNDGQFQSWRIQKSLSGTAESERTTLTPANAAMSCCETGESVRGINSSGTRAVISGPNGTRLILLPDCTTIATLSAEASSLGGFSSDDAFVFATSLAADSPARRWSAVDGSPVTTAVAPHDRFAFAWHEQGHRVGIDLAPKLRSVADDFSPRIHGQQASLHPSGLYYVTIEGGAADEIHFWSMTGKSLGPPIPHGRLFCVQFNPDGRSLITTSHTGTVRQWSLPIIAQESVAVLRESLEQMP